MACAFEEAVDDARRGVLGQPVQEQVGQQERREVVQREGVLEPVSGDVPGVPVAADVVHQHVELGEPVKDLVGKSAHLSLSREVRDEDVDLCGAHGTDLSGSSLGAGAVPAGDRRARAQGGESLGRRQADPRGAAGD